MPYRLTKIYTRTGDDGFTHLHNERIPKDDALVDVIGTLDELNSHIGLVIAFSNVTSVNHALTKIQHDLFDFGGELHVPEHSVIHSDHILWLEKTLDAWNETLAPLTEFVLPQGNIATCQCHVARTVCRRAERVLVRLHRQIALNNILLLQYLNRLSDVLFVAARILAIRAEDKEILWEHERKK